MLYNIRRFFYLCCIITLCTACSYKVSEDRPYNIVIVMTDDQGYGDLSYYDNPILKTPHIDALAAESVRLTNYHSATTCSPTRAGLLTGVNCNRTGTWHTIIGRSFLSTKYPTIAEYLQDARYNTAIFGKWHLGDNYPYRPQDRGFDHSVVHGGGGVGQTPDHWDNDYFDDTYLVNGKPQKFEGYCTDVWFSQAMKHIDKVKEEEEPFFCYISTNAPHSPHYAPQEYITPYQNDDRVVSPGFYGQIANIDANVGRLVEHLRKRDLLENTIFIFTSDNGTASGAALKDGYVVKGYNYGMRGKKVSPYEGGHRVPMFIRLPESLGENDRDHSDLTSHLDITPTLLDIAGHPISDTNYLDGQSIADLIVRKEQPSLDQRIVIVDTQRDKEVIKWKRSCVMQDQWRLVNQDELYELSVDPEQRTNVIDQYPDRATQLQAAYESWWTKVEEDSKAQNPIHIGAQADRVVILTCHDWMSDEESPWHQRHIRTAHVNNGKWLVEIKKAGTYDFQVYRWPRESGLAVTDTLPMTGELPGAHPYPAGVSINWTSASLQVGNQINTLSPSQDRTHFYGSMNLKEGMNWIKTKTIDMESIERGAYYVYITYRG